MPIKANLPRCPWVDLSKPGYVTYHDQEWGVPVHNDRIMFEFLLLEGAHAPVHTAIRRRRVHRGCGDQRMVKTDDVTELMGRDVF